MKASVCRFLLASLGALALVALMMQLTGSPARAGGGCHESTVSDSKGVSVDLRDACLRPTVLRVDLGETVTWTNRDAMAHTVTGANRTWGDYTELQQGDITSHQFTAAGVYPYFCLLHPGMVGAVVVGDGGSPAADELTSVASGGGQQQLDAAAAQDTSGPNRVRLYVVICAAIAIAAAGGGFALRGAIARR